jgi:AI-2 transport protein TqsA
MNDPQSHAEGVAPHTPHTPHHSRWHNPDTIRTISFVVIASAAGWYLMLQLAPVLRPLLIAAFLAYVLMPYHSRLRHHVGTPASLGILAGTTAAVLVVLAFVTYASVLALNDDLPLLQKRASELSAQAEQALAAHAPWLIVSDGKPGSGRGDEQFGRLARSMLNAAADTALEACVVALYLLFLLLEGSRFPDRIRKAYAPERAEEILQIAGGVSAAVISYLKAKVKSSLVLAVPVGVVLWAVGVKFALLWAILTFLCNFIPYIGTVIAYSLPVGFAFLWFGPTWEPFAAAGLLLVCHLGSASVAEPMIIGNAVGVSPLVILGSLAFWGLLWGIPGMFLAVPLTVVAILVMDHFEQTRPIARLLKGG